MSAPSLIGANFSLVDMIEDAKQEARLRALSDLVAPDKNGGGRGSFETLGFGAVQVEAGSGLNRHRWYVRSATMDCAWIVESQGEVGPVTSYKFESLQLRRQEINRIRQELDDVLKQCLDSQHQSATSPE